MENYAGYEKFFTLKNGKRLKIGFLNEQKRDGLIQFFQQTPEEDVQFCQENIRDPKIVDCWLRPENCRNILTLVAEELGSKQIVAHINLYRGNQAARNIGEIRQMLIARTFQGLGVGSRILDELLDLAAKANLKWLKVEVVTDLKHVIKALASRGFEIRATFGDYFTDHQEKAYDVALMMRNLSPKPDS
jgi:ribosomal protein S18 acetylase RimI-like enzyme